jgi:glycosyltransferase involved in cell wall biosynthesis
MKSASPERILFIVREFTLGGAGYLALRHMRRLVCRYGIDLLVTGPHEEAMLKQLPGQVSVFKLESFPDGTDPLIWLNFFRAHGRIRPFQARYLAVLGTSALPDWQSSMAFQLVLASRKLLFLVDEGLAAFGLFSPSHQAAVERAILEANLLVPVSNRLWQRMAERCPTLRRRPWSVLRPPLDIDMGNFDSPVSLPERAARVRPLVLTVSRLTADKQASQCLKVHQTLKKAGIEFRWYWLGSGPQEAFLRSEIETLGLAEEFLLFGHQPDVYQWMKHCDVFALLSSSEGCPTVVMEALSIGTAVIVTDVNGADELIVNERTGLIVSNDPDSIAHGLSRLVRDAGLREQFRRNLSAAPLVSNAVRETDWIVEQIENQDCVSDQPQVSILIPTYNHENFIDRAIASALMQDFPSLEVIVSDDASTDRTQELAQEWRLNPRFRYMRNERRLGRVANYHKALTQYARGDWVLMLDGDDHLMDPGFIGDSVEALGRNSGPPPLFAQAGHRVHFSSGADRDIDILPDIEGDERLMDGGEYLRLVYETGFFTHLGTLYNRAAAIKIGFYTADISSSDMESLLRLALEGKVLVRKSIAGYWVQHGKNASSNVPLNKVAENVRIFRRVARMAANQRLIAMRELDPILTRYEARILTDLLRNTLGKTAKSPLSVLRMLGIIISVNPRLMFDRDLMNLCAEYFRILKSGIRTDDKNVLRQTGDGQKDRERKA